MIRGTGEADRKRQFSSISSSPTFVAANAKKHPFVPSSEDKKQQSRGALDNFGSEMPRQHLVDQVESCSIHTKDLFGHDHDNRYHPATRVSYKKSLRPEDVFLHRLLDKGATESSYKTNSIPSQVQEFRESTGNKVQNTLRNIVHAIDGRWSLKDGLYVETIKNFPEASSRPNLSIELEHEVKSLRLAIGDMHMNHNSLARQMQFHRDTNARNKSELR